MSRFVFRLQSLLKYRESLRDQVRAKLARLLAADAQLVARRDSHLEARTTTLEEMIALQAAPLCDVNQLAARRYHAGYLLNEARLVEQQRVELAVYVTACRKELVVADQEVKVLEQLADRQRLEHEQIAEQRESRSREEAWQAGKLTRALQERTLRKTAILDHRDGQADADGAGGSTPPSHLDSRITP
jgi:flagellar biosynthesis chaperone FliJ